MFDNLFLTIKALIITTTDHTFCNNFLHLGYDKTKQNQMKLFEKSKNFSCGSRNPGVITFCFCTDCNKNIYSLLDAAFVYGTT